MYSSLRDVSVITQDMRYTLTPQAYPFFVRILHRHEVEPSHKSQLEIEGNLPPYPLRPNAPKAIPSVIRFFTGNKIYCNFTRQWQMYSAALIRLRVREIFPNLSGYMEDKLVENLFRYMYTGDRYQSNKHGTDNGCRNYVARENLQGDYIRLEPTITGGNIRRVVGKVVTIQGVPHYPIRCFDGNKAPPDAKLINFRTRPDLICPGVVESRTPAQDGGRECWSFESRGVSLLPYFILVNGSSVAYVPVSRCSQPMTWRQAQANDLFA